MRSNPTPELTSRPTHHLSTLSFYKPLFYNILDKITWLFYCHYWVPTFSSIILEEQDPIPTRKPTCLNCGRRKNVAKELTGEENLASMKRVANGGRRKGVRVKLRAKANDKKK
ncbi:hypothetical protein TNCV_3275051 [Trichonephila clavipes]|nr:hypothetical protein TNCV_3275051 [Trichonephila clavipes]